MKYMKSSGLLAMLCVPVMLCMICMTMSFSDAKPIDQSSDNQNISTIQDVAVASRSASNTAFLLPPGRERYSAVSIFGTPSALVDLGNYLLDSSPSKRGSPKSEYDLTGAIDVPHENLIDKCRCQQNQRRQRSHSRSQSVQYIS